MDKACNNCAICITCLSKGRLSSVQHCWRSGIINTPPVDAGVAQADLQDYYSEKEFERQQKENVKKSDGISNIRKAIFYVQQSIRHDYKDDKILLAVLDILVDKSQEK